MPESFGARLRRQREERGIALEALAKQTRIKATLLEALERDDLAQWPSGFYRRAFFRAYASAIGLDPDATFREFQQLYPEPPEGDVVAAMAAALGVDAGRSRMGLRSAVESAFSSLARLRPGAPGDSLAQAVTAANAAELPASVTTVATPPVPATARAREPVIDPPPAPAVERSAARQRTPTPERVPTPERAATPERTLTAERADAHERGDAPGPEPDPTAESRSGRAPVPDPAAACRPAAETDLEALARLCVELGCVTTEEGTRSLLQHAARLLGAAGLIVWAVDPRELQLHAALAHGYPPRLVAQLPMVRRGDNNATAEAFRTVQTRVFHDNASGKSALAVPLRTASGCVGVFAVELERGLEATKSRIAAATLLSAQLAPIADSLSRPMPFSLPYAVNGEVQTV